MSDDAERRSDAELLDALRRGERSAFRALVERHQGSLINFFHHLCWDRQVAEDCAQEVFLRVYNHRASYQPQAKFTTFLYTIARNLWIDRMRSAAVHGRPVSLESPAGEEQTLRERVASGVPAPPEILAKEEQAAALRKAIDRLPEEQRAVLVMAEIQGMKYQDIGAILNVPVGTVKSRMHTAMEKLKDLLSCAEPT
jgi:RNA polymerase sigma-70 factor (ECF subfamily)